MVEAPTDAVPMRPATAQPPTDAETVRQVGPAAAPPGAADAKSTVTADPGAIPSLKRVPAANSPLAAVATMPTTLETTPVPPSNPAPQAGAGSAIHPSGMRASEAQTEIPTGREESPVRIPVPQASGTRSIPAARATSHGLAPIENPPTAGGETPPATLAATAVPRSTGLIAASHTSLPPASPPANAAAAFEQMDAAAAPQVLASAPHRLAVGFHDSGLGWVEIRTHAAAGQISAVLATGSNEARAAATAYLPEVRAYLAGQQVAVGHLSAETYSTSSGDREGSPDGRPAGDSGRAHQAEPTAGRSQENFADESSDEPLSYINVRV
jgi:hypothetical protein